MKTKLLIKLSAILLLAIPTNSFAQAPNLGTAGSFALFTATGAFSNVGNATYVTGDVGTNAGAFGAFAPGTLTGNKQVVNTVSASAATDVATAYAFLSNKTCGTTLITPIGNGQILNPGVYCITTATSLIEGADSILTENLTFDAGGDPTALFFVKINGAFASSTNSQVILINGAAAENIYWQVGGQIALGAGSTFRGTIIADGAINLLEGANLYGRALSVAGAISMHNNLVDSEPAYNPATSLPNMPSQATEIASIYPNPSNGSIIIDLQKDSKTKSTQIKLYNSLGVEMMNKSLSNYSTTISTAKFLPGIYYYKLLDGNKKTQSGKLIFQ